MLSQFSCAPATWSINFLSNDWDRVVARIRASRGATLWAGLSYPLPTWWCVEILGWDKLGSANVCGIVTRCNQQTHLQIGPVGLLVGSAGVRALCGLVVVGVQHSGCHRV